MESTEFAALVERAKELRAACKGRLPERVLLKWTAFIVGTMHFTGADVGAYFLLLLYQLDKGSLPTDVEKLAKIARFEATEFEPMWKLTISEKFREAADGCLYNSAMLQEFIAEAETLIGYRERGHKGGKRSGEVRRQAANTDEQPF